MSGRGSDTADPSVGDVVAILDAGKLNVDTVACGPEQLRIQTEELGHSIIRSLIRFAPPCLLCSCALLRSLSSSWDSE